MKGNIYSQYFIMFVFENYRNTCVWNILYNKMSEYIKNNRKIILGGILSFSLVLWMQRKIWVVSTDIGYRVVELLFTVCITIALTWIIDYLLLENDNQISNQVLRGYYFKLFLIQTCAFLPLYMQNFMYGDDFWWFDSNFSGSLERGLYFNRPFICFLRGILNDTSFLSIRYFRICNGIILLVFGCVLFRYLSIKIGNCKVAFFFSVLTIGSCTAVDCIGYATIFPINSSLLLSASSLVAYMKAQNSIGQKKLMFLGVSGISLFSAFCMYQIGTPIVFLLYMISERVNSNSKECSEFGRLKKAFFYLIYYGIIAILYLLITKGLQALTGVALGQSQRGEIITSAGDIIKKIIWFFSEVYPQAFTRIAGIFAGGLLFREDNMFYHCTYLRVEIGVLIECILIILIIISIINCVYKQQSVIYAFIAIIAIPLSFWPFLVLPESSFVTYYALGIILLLLWYVFDGILVIKDYITSKLKFNSNRIGEIFYSIIILIIVLQSNFYSENAWVNSNRDSYEYLANSIVSELSDKDNIDTIIIRGNLNPYPGGGHDYVIYCVYDILKEMGYNADLYKVVQSDNGYYPLNFSDTEASYAKEILGEETLNKILQYYVHDIMYSRWLYNGMKIGQSEMEFLQECFIKTNLIAIENDTSISINMEGIYTRNFL